MMYMLTAHIYMYIPVYHCKSWNETVNVLNDLQKKIHQFIELYCQLLTLSTFANNNFMTISEGLPIIRLVSISLSEGPSSLLR